MTFNPLNFFTGTPIGSALTGIFTAFDQAASSRRAEERNAENERQVRQILGDRITSGQFQTGTFGRLQNRSAVGMRDRMDRLLQQRTTEGLGILSRIGDQDRQDLRQSFGNAASAANAQLAGQGLAGTSIGAGVRAGFTTARTAAQNRLSDAIAQRELGAFAGLTGDRLQTLQGNEGSILDTRERSFNRMLQTWLGTTGDYANFVNTIDVPYPQQGQLLQGLGAAAVDPPSRSSRAAWWPRGIELGGKALSAVALSDQRFKRNMVALGEARDFDGVVPVEYDWRTEEFLGFPSGRQKGVVAQQVREVFPEVIIVSQEGYLMVDYQRLIHLVPQLAAVLWDMIPVVVG